MKKRFISLLAIGLSCMMILGGCGKKGPEQSENGGSSSVQMDSEQVLNTIYFEVATLDANDTTDNQSSSILNAVQEGLVRIENNGKGDEIVPAGAEKWEASEDGLTWTFHLRKMNWSDGEAVVAKHYVDSFQRILNPDNGFAYGFLAYDIEGAEEYNTGKGTVDAVGVKAVDDYTLEFKLKHPVPYFASKVSYTTFHPIRLDIIEKLGDKYASEIKDTVYNGPFKIESWDNGNSMVLVKNDTYWDADNVYLQKINMTKIQEFATQAQLFEAQELDITGAQTDYIEKWTERADAGEFQKLTGEDPGSFYLYFNQKSESANGILKNAKIRKAIGLSIDRDVYTKDLVGRFQSAYGVVPTAINVGDEKYRDKVEGPLESDAKTYVNNKEKLQELFKEGLKELGLQTDDLSKYELTYLSQGSSELQKQRSEWLAQQVNGNLGIKINVETQGDWGVYLSIMDKLEYDFTMSGWSADYNDPMSFLDIWVSNGGNNHTGYADTEYDELLKSVYKETEQDKVTEIYKKLENKLVNEDAVISPVYYTDKYAFYQNYVKDIQFTSFGSVYEFKHAYIQGKN
ncbi:peptide ABC transporter substrate-binding protein [Clostridium tertium]|uniref:peptide ABC transporter substrate-binding protein n=1 Tax=Clostridium tertium TaxID=1559 RepID=UPI00189F7A0A|nr:peptide ABC transporter substrate-binding protein [Clostridium tertium]MDB1948491.1 peptide ABC transporter substrate-binding protein [Clostridium tertium]MDB1954779.1 peptide ABC transporter substrate-binding protein [Clostridium tertium]MDB1957176.1 peptide ABC transporter substrate-binding protein [Clostridium tertium]MDB1961317.1 peptide ABC transporter substrate-binding protein [Clostridium tertium]MDB1966448.1 peptide ABC transporter substrate-binding protein [Clostridium tertium]